MADKKRKRPTYKHGQEIRAILTREQVVRRNEIKLLISSLTGTPYGRVSDSAILGKALDMYYEKLVVEKENELPDGFELLDDEDALTNDPP